MYVEYFNLYYFVYISLGILMTIGLVMFLKNKTQDFRYWFIFGMIMFAFIVHFLKIFIYPYTTHVAPDHILSKISLENICAVSTVAFPFLYFTKNKTLKDYMVMVGIASGILTFLVPVDAVSETFNGNMNVIGQRSAFSLEIIRFYTAHYILFAVPFLMMHYKMHKLSVDRVFRAPLMLIAVLVIIFINEFIITYVTGWVSKDQFFDVNGRNPSFIFGTNGKLSDVGLILGILVPTVFRSNPFTGSPQLWPVIWLILPALVYGTIIGFIFMFIYDKDNTIKYLKHKILRTKVEIEELTEKEVEKEMNV